MTGMSRAVGAAPSPSADVYPAPYRWCKCGLYGWARELTESYSAMGLPCPACESYAVRDTREEHYAQLLARGLTAGSLAQLRQLEAAVGAFFEFADLEGVNRLRALMHLEPLRSVTFVPINDNWADVHELRRRVMEAKESERRHAERAETALREAGLAGVALREAEERATRAEAGTSRVGARLYELQNQIQDDLAALARALRQGDHARPMSCRDFLHGLTEIARQTTDELAELQGHVPGATGESDAERARRLCKHPEHRENRLRAERERDRPAASLDVVVQGLVVVNMVRDLAGVVAYALDVLADVTAIERREALRRLRDQAREIQTRGA